MVEELYQRRERYKVAYRRPVYANGARGPEEREVIHIRDIKKMTAVTDESIIEKYGVAPNSGDDHRMMIKLRGK